MTLSFPLTLTDRFALIMRALREAVAARIRCPPVTAEIIVYVCARLRRITVAFEKLAAQIRAGTYVARPVGTCRAVGKGSRGTRPGPHALHYQLGLPPWQSAWLHRIAPGDAGVWTEALRKLITEPEMAAVLAAVPRMGRILQPLRFMLGIEASLARPGVPPAPAVAGADRDATLVAPAAHVGAAHATIAPDDTPPHTTVRTPDIPGAIFRAL